MQLLRGDTCEQTAVKKIEDTKEQKLMTTMIQARIWTPTYLVTGRRSVYHATGERVLNTSVLQGW